MNEICDDNRFEIIEAAKQRLIEATNIEMRPRRDVCSRQHLVQDVADGLAPRAERAR